MTDDDAVQTATAIAPYLSHTRVSTYADCSEKYRLLYIEDHPREPQGALIGGIAVHETISKAELYNVMLQDEPFTDDGLVNDWYQHELARGIEQAGGADQVRWGGRKSKAFPNGKDAGWWAQYGFGMVRTAHSIRTLDESLGVSLVDAEMEVGAILPSGTRLTTRLDELLITDDGAYIIRDWKTGMPRDSTKLQNTLYGIACEQTLGIRVPQGQVAYLGLSTPRVDAFDLHDLRDVTLAWVAQAEGGMAQGIYVMNPGSYCTSCPVRQQCAWGRTLEEAASG